ncbi:hypothetical protein [Persicobacter psychrovividus]
MPDHLGLLTWKKVLRLIFGVAFCVGAFLIYYRDEIFRKQDKQ